MNEIHEYKGYKFYNHIDLAHQLHIPPCNIKTYIDRFNRTCEDFIDRFECDEHYRHIPETQGEYKNYKWRNHDDLAKQLGVSRQYICKLSKRGELKNYLDCRG